MRIDRIDIYRVCNPIKAPYTTAFGTAQAFNAILVKLTSGEQDGWGEAAPWAFPGFSAEYDVTAFHTAREFLAGLLVGREVATGESLQAIFSAVKGNNFAKAAFDLAWWDLAARMAEQPFWKMIGGTGEEVTAGTAIGVLTSLDELMTRIQSLIDTGYPRIKLKYCPGWGLEMVKAVRTTFPDLVMHIDCNSAYTLADAEMFRRLDQVDLAMIEQPLMHDDLIDHAVLQKSIRTPICLDESITSPAKARQAAQIGACQFVNIKHGRVGGITNALKIHDICLEAGIPCWIGAMGESALGVTFSMSLATLPNVKYPSDITPSEKFYERNLCCPVPHNPSPGRYVPAGVPGIGVEPDPEVLAQVALDRAEITG